MNPIHNGVPQTLTARWRHRAYSAPPTRNLTLKASVPRPGVPRPYPPSRPFRAANLRVGNESSRSISCPTHLHWEWTVRHHPYRLQRIGRWVTIASDCHHPPSWSFRAAHLPVGIESSRSARALGAFAESIPPFPDRAPISGPAVRNMALSEKSPYLFAESALLQGVLLPKQVFAPNPKQFSLSGLLGASTRWALAIRS